MLDISAYVEEDGGTMKTQNGNHKPATTTQGPWTVGPYVENDYEPAYFPVERDERDADGFKKDVVPLIAKSTYGATVEDKLANARLLAAAPELLKALKYITTQAWWSENDHPSATNMEARLGEILTEARDAIAKSEGK